MGSIPFINDSEFLESMQLILTYCIRVIDVETAAKLKIDFTEEDVKEGTIRGVYYSTNDDNFDFIDTKAEEIQTAWVKLGFFDGEFVTERRLNEKYLGNVRKMKKNTN